MEDAMAEREILDSWKEISAYLKRDARTCQRYERELGLPVHRLDGSPRARVFGYKDELDAWLAKTAHERVRAERNLRFYVLAAAPVILAAALLILWAPWKHRDSLGLKSDRPGIAIVNFDNTSGDPGLNEWRTGLPLMLTTDLGQSRYLAVLSYDEVYSVIKKCGLIDADVYSRRDLGRVARAGRAVYTVTGGIMEAGEHIIIALSMVDHVKNEARQVSFECDGEREIPAMVDRMTTQIKAWLGLSRSQITGDYDALTVDITTNSIAAFKLYSEGRRLHLALEYEKSLGLMLAAIQKDPEFPLAYRSLSAACSGLGRTEEARTYLQKAWDLRENTTLKERLLIEAHYNLQAQETYGRALEVCRNWLEIYPGDGQALQTMGYCMFMSGDFKSSIRFLEASLLKGNLNPFCFYHLACAYAANGSQNDARDAVERGLAVHPDNDLIELALFDQDLVKGHFDEAQSLLDEWRTRRQGPGIVIREADLKLLRGEIDEAASILARHDRTLTGIMVRLPSLELLRGKLGRAVEVAREVKDYLALARLSYLAGDPEAALAAARIAYQQASSEGRITSQAWALQMKGLAELALGSPEAQVTADKLEAIGRGSPIRGLALHHLYLKAMIGLQSGRLNEALQDFEMAVALLPGECWENGSNWQAVFIDALAQARFQSGDLGRAERAYKKIQSLGLVKLRYGDIYIRSFYWLGRIAEARGKKDEARVVYGRFLDLWKNADTGLLDVEDAKKRLEALLS